MGFIREPEGVDFLVQNKTFTEAEQKELSLLIQECKRKTLQAEKKRARKKKVMA